MSDTILDGPTIREYYSNNHNLGPSFVLCGPNSSFYPGQYHARLFVTKPRQGPTSFVVVADTLENLRRLLPEGMVVVKREIDDPHELEETWT